MHFLDFFATSTSSFQVKPLFSKKLFPFQRKDILFGLICTVGSVIRSKSLTNTEIPLKTENFSKIVWGTLFGTFSSKYQIILSKKTFLSENGYPFRGGTIRLDQFGM